jgi:polar amino acid transport system substrate-binding protein
MKCRGRVGGPLLFVLLALAGCGNASSMHSGESASIAAQVPDAVKSNGTLTVVTDPTYPPNEFLSPEDETLTGMDPELMRAVGALMGLKVKFVYEPFDKILADVAVGDYDVGASSFTDTKKREQTVDFVDYYAAGTSFYSSAYVYTDVENLAGLCGHVVAVGRGTTQQEDATAQSTRCVAAGKRPVSVLSYATQSEASAAIADRQAQVAMADSPFAYYQGVLSIENPVEVVGTYGVAPYGFATAKNGGLAAPMLSAVKALIAHGTYQRILETWGIQAGAITTPRINGAQR